MTHPAHAYPHARAVAERAHAHMARQLASTGADDEGREGDGGPPGAGHAPGAHALAAVIDTAFWASLRREEGYAPRISLAFLAPGHAVRPLTFGRRIALDAVALARLAPAVERPGIHLGVWPDGAGPVLWGTTHDVPRLCLVLEVVAPGLLVLKYRRGAEAGKFVNLAVLEGDQVTVLDERDPAPAGCPPLLASLLGVAAPAPTPRAAGDVLVRLAVSMRAHGRGGTLLVVPPGERWRESVVPSIPYAVAPAYTELADLVRRDARARRGRGWGESARRVVDAVAGLTAVDGATVLGADFTVLAFGAKIARRRESAPVEAVLASGPARSAAPLALTPTELGGTRHLSAAQFVHDQRDALALVASQDGRFTIFGWAPEARLVRAHRIEALLL